MLYHAALLATSLFSLSMATKTVTVESTVTVCPCTTPGSIFSSATASAGFSTPSSVAVSVTKSSPDSSAPYHTTTSTSSAAPTCGMLHVACDDVTAPCCTQFGYYCDKDSKKCTDDDEVEGTSDTTTPPASNTTPPSAPSTTAPLTGATPTCGMLGSPCDNSEQNQNLLCCTDIGYYCDSDSSKCTSDDAIEDSS